MLFTRNNNMMMAGMRMYMCMMMQYAQKRPFAF